MWNLPGSKGRHQAPSYDKLGTQGEMLVNGKPCSNESLSKKSDRILSGNTPYEASSMYSDELEDLMRRCLRYRLANRPSVGKLREEMKKYGEGEVKPRAEGRLELTIEGGMSRFRVGKSFVEWEEGSEGSGEGENSW
jgi:hypothetical protein